MNPSKYLNTLNVLNSYLDPLQETNLACQILISEFKNNS